MSGVAIGISLRLILPPPPGMWKINEANRVFGSFKDGEEIPSLMVKKGLGMGGKTPLKTHMSLENQALEGVFSIQIVSF